MAETPKPKQKSSQVSLDDYLKLKEKRAKAKLGLKFPPVVLAAVLIPLGLALLYILYFVFYLRFLPEY